MNIYLFLLGSFLGFIYEYLLNFYPSYNFNLKIPLLFIYGTGLVLVNKLYKKFKNKNIVFRFIIYIFVFTILEYIVSIFNKTIRNKDTWVYSNGKQISVDSSIMWGILGLFGETLL